MASSSSSDFIDLTVSSPEYIELDDCEYESDVDFKVEEGDLRTEESDDTDSDDALAADYERRYKALYCVLYVIVAVRPASLHGPAGGRTAINSANHHCSCH